MAKVKSYFLKSFILTQKQPKRSFYGEIYQVVRNSILITFDNLTKIIFCLWFTFGLNSSWGEWRWPSSNRAPRARTHHTAVWTGQKMIIWGGWVGNLPFFNNGGIYDPKQDYWRTFSVRDKPVARSLHTAVWTGEEMIYKFIVN